MNPSVDLSALATALAHPAADDLQEVGITLGKLYTDHGLPVDMALDRLSLPKDLKLLVVHGVCQWMIQHRRNSNAPDRAIKRQQAVNAKILAEFSRTGEVGLY